SQKPKLSSNPILNKRQAVLIVIMIYSKLFFALLATVLVAQAAPIPFPTEGATPNSPTTSTSSHSSGNTIDHLPSGSASPALSNHSGSHLGGASSVGSSPSRSSTWSAGSSEHSNSHTGGDRDHGHGHGHGTGHGSPSHSTNGASSPPTSPGSTGTDPFTVGSASTSTHHTGSQSGRSSPEHPERPGSAPVQGTAAHPEGHQLHRAKTV
ncbi:hypothetical protein FRC17_010923, partial [Serendipita sp. 399]